MSNQNKWIVGGIIVVVAAIIIYAVYSNNNSGQMSQNDQSTTTNTNTTASSTPTTTPVTTVGGTKLSYGDAIKAYPERFQFSKICQGTPATIAVRVNTPVMLDNRNTTAITLKADTQTFKLAGYGYDVFYPKVLGNIVVTCNGKNSVTLNVEK